MKYLQNSLFTLSFTLLSIHINAQCFSQQTFTTPGQSTFTIPGATGENFLIEIEAKGADGGDFLWGGNPQTDGGEGATMKASFVVPGGSDLLVVVGSSGFDAPGSPGGGGGGGGTAVIIDNANVLIAAGAGGGGGQGAANTGQGGQANTDSPAVGGLGLGSSGGGGFNADGGDGPASTGGGAGTLAGQGTGGMGGVTAGSGGAGFGGGGGGSGTVGGGGGGYKGGDGSDGSSDLNGKGGDSYVNTLFSGTVIFNTPGADGGGANNNGSVIITCIPQGDVEISLVSQSDPECFGGFGGSIEVAATGGLEPYQYSLNGGTYGDSPIFTGLSAGDYTVTVQDGTGSTAMLMVTLTSPSEIIGEIVNIVDNVCFGASEGSIEVSASGGTSATGAYGYSINGSAVQSSGTFINLPNGFYVISIFDDNLCTTQVTGSITSPDDLEIVVIDKVDISCFGSNSGVILVDAFGGTPSYMYAINDEPFGSSSQFFGLAGGTHIVKVMDSEGCIEELIVFIDEAEPIEFDIIVTPPTCYLSDDGVIDIVNISGGIGAYQFTINNGPLNSDSTFTGLFAGTYLVTVFDSSGCSIDEMVEMANPDSLILSLTVVMDVECGGDSTGAVLLELQNGVGQITYSLDQMINFTGLFENLGAGEYTGSATDSLGCTTEINFEIQESASFSISIDSVTHVKCFGGMDGSVFVGVEDGIDPIQFSLDGGDFQDSPMFSGLSAGMHEVEVIDSTGCVKAIEFSISEPAMLAFDYLEVTNVACYGELTGQVEFSVTGGNAPYFYTDNIDVITFTADDTLSIDSLAAGDFVVFLCDHLGCELRDTVSVAQNDSLVLFISEVVGDSCGLDNTGFVDLNAVGGYAPLVITLNGDTSDTGEFVNLEAGTYTAMVVDDLGCSTGIEFNLPQIGGLVIDSFHLGNVTCNGDEDGYIEIFIGSSQGEVSYFVDGVMTDDNFIDNLSGGSYTITALDEEGCMIEMVFEINEPNPLTIEVTDANFGEGYITVSANGGTQPYRYSIDDKATTQDSATFTGLESGDYVIIVIDANGCENSVAYSLTGVNDSEFEGLNIYPNPVKDVLHVEFEGVDQDLRLEILNKLGQVIRGFDKENISISDTVFDLPIRGIPTGTYILRLKQKDRIGHFQIVIIE